MQLTIRKGKVIIKGSGKTLLNLLTIPLRNFSKILNEILNDNKDSSFNDLRNRNKNVLKIIFYKKKITK